MDTTPHDMWIVRTADGRILGEYNSRQYAYRVALKRQRHQPRVERVSHLPDGTTRNEPDTESVTPSNYLPCEYLGRQLGETACSCGSDGGSVAVHECLAGHGRPIEQPGASELRVSGCQLANHQKPHSGVWPLPRLPSCSTCDFHARTSSLSVATPMRQATTERLSLIGVPIDREKLVTHILYHIMPLAGTGEQIWRRHVAWLRSVRPQFNGRLIVGVVTKGRHDKADFSPIADVKSAFDGLDAEFVVKPNDRRKKSTRRSDRGLAEGVTFLDMLRLIRTDDPNEVFFYGHSKGVTYSHFQLDAAPHLWADAMFQLLFTNRDAAIDALDSAGIVGSFRSAAPIGDGRHKWAAWHYSGTFFAARSAEVFRRRQWGQLQRRYGCVEQWPGLIFNQQNESACLFCDNVGSLYDGNYWEREVTPAFERWKLERKLAEASPRAPASATAPA